VAAGSLERKARGIYMRWRAPDPRGRPKRTWREVVQKDCQARNLNREDATDRGRWKKLIKIG